MIKVELPCKSIVKAYLNSFANRGRIYIDQNSRIGKYIFSQVQKQPSEKDHREVKYKNSVVIYMPYDSVIRSGVFFTKTAITNINNQITDIIYDEIFLVTEAMQETTKKRYVLNEALELYCRKKNIDSSFISIGNVRKQWFRHQQSSKNLKINA